MNSTKCPYCAGACIAFGFYKPKGSVRVGRLRCQRCQRTHSRLWRSKYEGNFIPSAKKQRAIALLNAGESIRRTAVEVGIAPMTANRLRKLIIAEKGTILCPCGKPGGHHEWCGYRISKHPNRVAWLLSLWRDISHVNIFVPSRARYDRPEIPHERSTELPLLVNQRFMRSLDAAFFDSDADAHSVIAAPSLTPLESLLLKEEQESPEFLERKKRIIEWNAWALRKRKSLLTLKMD